MQEGGRQKKKKREQENLQDLLGFQMVRSDCKRKKRVQGAPVLGYGQKAWSAAAFYVSRALHRRPLSLALSPGVLVPAISKQNVRIRFTHRGGEDTVQCSNQ